MRNPKKTATTDIDVPVNYTINDKSAVEIAGIRITEQHHKDGINLTANQAMHYVASGTLTTADQGEAKIAREAVKARQEEVGRETGATTTTKS